MTSTTTHRAYKFRFYPTEEQTDLFLRTFGCVRLVYNKSLAVSTQRWRTDKKSTSFSEMSGLLTQWKKEPELAFLTKVAAVALQQSQRNLTRAFQNFWKKRAHYPRFKKKGVSRDSFTLVGNAVRYVDGTVHVAKSKEPLNIVWSRRLPKGSVSSATISHNKAGQWFISLLMEETIEHLPPTGKNVGIDLGLNSFSVTSEGVKTKHPRMSKEEKTKRVSLARSLSRKKKGSANREKARQKLTRFDQKIVDRRRDFLHKLSTEIIRSTDIIVIEDLNVSGMSASGGSRKKGLNRAISEASWSEFRTMLEYKSHWYGRDLRIIDRWFPSSQMCSECGHIDGRKALSTRQWVCPECGTRHDRDINAAKNILAAGLAVNVCGDGRSLRHSSGDDAALVYEAESSL